MAVSLREVAMQFRFEGNADDASGKNKHATLDGGSFVEGVSGKALRLDGGDKADLPNSGMGNKSPFSIMGWIYREDSNDRTIYSEGADDGFDLSIISNRLQLKTKGVKVYSPSDVDIPVDEWVHFAAVLHSTPQIPKNPTNINLQKLNYAQRLSLFSPVLYYPLDGDFNDVSGRDIHLTAFDGPPGFLSGEGPNGQDCLSLLNNRHARAEGLGNNSSIISKGPVTVCCWVRLTDANVGYIYSERGDGVGNWDQGFALRFNNRYIQCTAYGRSDFNQTVQQLSLNTWHHVAMTWNNNIPSIYIDGELAATNTGSALGQKLIGASDVSVVGGLKTAANYPNDFVSPDPAAVFQVSELMVFNRILDIHELKMLATFADQYILSWDKNHVGHTNVYVGSPAPVLIDPDIVSSTNMAPLDLDYPEEIKIAMTATGFNDVENKLFSSIDVVLDSNGDISSANAVAPQAMAEPRSNSSQHIVRYYIKGLPAGEDANSEGMREATDPGLIGAPETGGVIRIDELKILNRAISQEDVRRDMLNFPPIGDVTTVEPYIPQDTTGLLYCFPFQEDAESRIFHGVHQRVGPDFAEWGNGLYVDKQGVWRIPDGNSPRIGHYATAPTTRSWFDLNRIPGLVANLNRTFFSNIHNANPIQEDIDEDRLLVSNNDAGNPIVLTIVEDEAALEEAGLLQEVCTSGKVFKVSMSGAAGSGGDYFPQ
jgi:hypothetical protein